MEGSEIFLKCCARCHLEKFASLDKEISEFTYRKNRKGERVPRSQCKRCEADQAGEWNRNNFERVRANKVIWNNSSRGRESVKRTREKRKEIIHANQKIWREQNREYDLQRKRRYAIEVGNSKRRFRESAQFVEAIDRNRVYEMYGGMCGICKEFIDLKIEKGFHVDHETPLSKGGLHAYINVQPAHIICNLRKGNKELL